jgi:hypothetical protein
MRLRDLTVRLAGQESYVSKDFDNISRWSGILDPLKNRALSILEVGSSAGNIWVLNNEAAFDAAVKPFAGRVEKIRGRSVPTLDTMIVEGRSFDIIYVDGSHTHDDALMDSVLCWQLLKPEGLIIWDDYVWGLGNLPVAERCKEAIDEFMAMHPDELCVIEKGYQVIARRVVNGGYNTAIAEGFTYSRTLRNFWRLLRQRPLHSPHHGR